MKCVDVLAIVVLLLVLSPQEWIGNAVNGVTVAYDVAKNESTTSILRRLLNESNMDPRIRPSVDGEPVQVKCGFFVVSFGSISEVNMDYTMNIYLRQEWHDDRMSFEKDKVLSLTAKAIEKMWTPDLFFPNEKQAAFHTVTTPNKLMKIYPNGTIVYSIRLTLKLSCPMNLENFPMDHQECHFKVESYSMNTNEMMLHWFSDTPVEVSENVELPQFDLVDWHHGECETSYKTGSFPCLRASFRLKRQFGFFLLQTYIPTILIVILSWVSFWINMEAVPARISLGVTTVLTMATQLSGSKAAIPRVSYPKAIDVWMSMCMLFVFLALVEYAFVNAMSRKNKGDHKKDDGDAVKKDKYRNENTIPLMSKVKHGPVSNQGREDDGYIDSLVKAEETNDEEALPRGLQVLNVRRVLAHSQAARILDKTSRILFPAIFVVFNLVYWPVYLQHKLFE